MKKLIVVVSILIISAGEIFGQADSYTATLKKMLEVAGTETTFKVL